jgi:uncharacterized protein (DUF1778 family)
VTAARRDPAKRTRITVVCSAAQKDLVTAAAKTAKADTSSWVLVHALAATRVENVAGSPLVILGPAADRLRAMSDEQGISAERALEQLLIASGG